VVPQKVDFSIGVLGCAPKDGVCIAVVGSAKKVDFSMSGLGCAPKYGDSTARLWWVVAKKVDYSKVVDKKVYFLTMSC
jgi:hypothetical protein